MRHAGMVALQTSWASFLKRERWQDMDPDKPRTRELVTAVSSKDRSKDGGTVENWVTRLSIISCQVIVVASLFLWFKGYLLARLNAAGPNIYLGILGCTLATICAFLILWKYQKIIQQFGRDNVRLGEMLGARTYALEKTNEELHLEIAEKARVQKALMDSESRFRTIIREAALGIALIDRQGRVLEGNPALSSMLGYTPEELRGTDFTRINHPEHAESSWENFQRLLAGKQDICRVETRYLRKDGWSGWGRVFMSLVRDAGGNPQFAITLFEDITERRESEEKIRTYQAQLQSLASELSLTEERERRRLATVLHDQIAQLLMLAKGKFEKIQESTIGRRHAKPMAEIRKLIEESIRYTRSLVFELSPPILYDLGFEPAMEWLAEHMEKQYGLVVHVEDDEQPKPLDNEARVLLFRAVRELLFNVLKHAQSGRASLRLLRDGDHLQIIVADHGVGFAPDKLEASSGKMAGFGLFSIRERLNYFGGSMEIESNSGKGARVILTMPLTVNRKKACSLPKPCFTLGSGSFPQVSKGSSWPLAKTRSQKICNHSALTGR
jgi:PAS domain S-box-containing protein